MDTERRGRVSNEMGGGEGCSTSPGEKETLPGKGKLGQEPSGPAGTLPPHRDPGRPSQLKCVHLIPRASTAVEGNQDHFRPSLSADRGLGLHSSPLLAIVAPHGSRHFWEGGSFPAHAYFRPRLQLVLQPWGWNFRSSPAPSAVLFRVMAAGCPGCSPGKSFFSHSSSAFPGSLGERVPWDCWCPRGSSAFLICTQPRTVGVTPWSWEFGAGRGGLARAPGSGYARAPRAPRKLGVVAWMSVRVAPSRPRLRGPGVGVVTWGGASPFVKRGGARGELLTHPPLRPPSSIPSPGGLLVANSFFAP